MLPATLLREFRARWKAEKRHLEHFCRNSVPGGRRGDATWNAFAGKPWQVGSGKGYLERFHGDSVPGGRQRRTPGTLLREYRGRWTAGRDTWNTFAGIPCQVEGREGHLERFRGNTVPGGRQRRTPDTLLREFRARWAAGRCHLEHFCGDSVPGGRRRRGTWNTFAGIPCQVGGGEMPPDTLLRGYSATLPGEKFYWDMKLNLY